MTATGLTGRPPVRPPSPNLAVIGDTGNVHRIRDADHAILIDSGRAMPSISSRTRLPAADQVRVNAVLLPHRPVGRRLWA